MSFEENEYSVSFSASSSSSSDTDHRNSPSCNVVSNNFSSNNSEATSQLVSHKKRAGRKKFKETRHPIYRGVRQRKNQWVCEVREPNKKTRIWLGTHPTPEMAARAYDVAAIALRGKSAPLNFNDSLWVLPRAKSSLAKDIQMAAMEGAEAFRPDSSSSSSSQSSSSTVKSTRRENARKVPESSTPFMDEDELFNMPGLLDSMAEGMLISPPEFHKDLSLDDDVVELNNDFTLWS